MSRLRDKVTRYCRAKRGFSSCFDCKDATSCGAWPLSPDQCKQVLREQRDAGILETSSARNGGSDADEPTC